MKVRTTQREKMRELFNLYGADVARLVAEYARAEDNGEVDRKQNSHQLRPEVYARMLLADGFRKGWLRSSNRLARRPCERLRVPDVFQRFTAAGTANGIHRWV